MKLKYIVFYIFCAFWVGSCAKMMPLTGGDKDAVPPTLVKSSPDTFSTHFTSKEIKLVFNEFVTVDDPSRKILFSPALTKEPSFISNTKGVTIKLKEDLKPNTTYTVRLQSAIKDLNEGNILEEQLYVFSTGPNIDSGKVVGLVLNYSDNLPLKDVKVGLYPTNITPQEVRITKPEFWSMTRSDGTFQIPYIRKENYKIYAIKEEDNSFLYDRAGEGIAFLKDEVRADTLVANTLFLYSSSADSVKLLKTKYRGNGTFSFLFSKPIANVNFQVSDSVGPVPFKQSNQLADSVLIWMDPENRKYAKFIVNVESLVDTATIKIREISKVGRASVQQKPSLLPSPSMELGLFDTLAIQFNSPVNLVNPSLIHFMIDSSPQPFNILENPNNPLQWQLFFQPLSNKKYNLEVIKGAFLTYTTKDTIDSLQFDFGFLKASDYANMEVRFKNRPLGNSLIVSLTKDKKIVSRTVFNSMDTVLNVSNLSPGKYSISAFVDEDNNGLLSEGDFDTQKLPERLYILQKDIIIRRGFDQKVTWDFTSPKGVR